jgi:hypothetical protein
VRLGDVNVLQFVAAQDKVLRFQHDFVDTQREYWLALFELERAIGARLDDVAGRRNEPWPVSARAGLPSPCSSSWPRAPRCMPPDVSRFAGNPTHQPRPMGTLTKETARSSMKTAA